MPELGKCHEYVTGPSAARRGKGILKSNRSITGSIPLEEAALALIVLLVHADAHGHHQSEVDTWRNRQGVGLLAKEQVAAAEQLSVDAADDEARLLVDNV